MEYNTYNIYINIFSFRKKIKGITSVKIFKRSEQSIDNDIQLFHFTCNYEIDVSLEFARKRIN